MTMHLIRSKSLIVSGIITQELTDEIEVPLYRTWSTPDPLAIARGHLEAHLKKRSSVTAARSTLRSILDELPGGWHTAFAILESIAKKDSESEEAKLMAAWLELQAAHPKDPITPEMIAEAADITPWHMLGLVTEAAFKMRVTVSRLVGALGLDEIMERAVKEAKKSTGFKDRERILQNAGLYPAPSGVTIFNNPTALASARTAMATGIEAAEGLDDFERDTLDSTSFLRGIDNANEDQKRLESPSKFVEATIVPAEKVEQS
jgi:hypothetical protein